MTQRATDFNPTSKLLCSVFEVKMRSGSLPSEATVYVVLKKADELVASREMAVMCCDCKHADAPEQRHRTLLYSFIGC